MYNTLFPRTNASPYLFFNWPLTYSCFFFVSRSVGDFAFGRAREPTREEASKRQNNTKKKKPSFCAPSIEPVTREDMKRVVVESSVGESALKRATSRSFGKKEKATLGFPSIAIEGRSTRSRAVGSPVENEFARRFASRRDKRRAGYADARGWR